MLTLTGATQTALDSGQTAVQLMYKFELGSGNYGFWTGLEPITPPVASGIDAAAQSQLFRTGGSVFDMEASEQTADATAPELTIRLRANALDTSLPGSGASDALASIYSDVFMFRNVYVFAAIINVTTEALISVIRMHYGRIRQLSTITKYDTEADLSEEYLECKVETVAIDWHRTAGHDSSDEDQLDTFPGDKFFEHATGRQRTKWGKTGSTGSSGSWF